MFFDATVHCQSGLLVQLALTGSYRAMPCICLEVYWMCAGGCHLPLYFDYCKTLFLVVTVVNLVIIITFIVCFCSHLKIYKFTLHLYWATLLACSRMVSQRSWIMTLERL